MVKSQQAKKRETHILDASISKATERAAKSFKKLCRQAFACEIDAQKALVQWQTSEPFTLIHEARIIRHEKRAKRGRPGASDSVVVTYKLQVILPHLCAPKKKLENFNGLFILGTNDVKSELKMQFLLDEYKSQQA